MLLFVQLFVSRALSHCKHDMDTLSQTCVTLRGQIKEAACSSRKQDLTLPENRALNKCEESLKQV